MKKQHSQLPGYSRITSPYRDVEELQEENLQLKKLLNRERQENAAAKTKIQRQEMQLKEKDKIIEQILDPSKISRSMRCHPAKWHKCCKTAIDVRKKIMHLEDRCREQEGRISELLMGKAKEKEKQKEVCTVEELKMKSDEYSKEEEVLPQLPLPSSGHQETDEKCEDCKEVSEVKDVEEEESNGHAQETIECPQPQLPLSSSGHRETDEKCKDCKEVSEVKDVEEEVSNGDGQETIECPQLQLQVPSSGQLESEEKYVDCQEFLQDKEEEDVFYDALETIEHLQTHLTVSSAGSLDSDEIFEDSKEMLHKGMENMKERGVLVGALKTTDCPQLQHLPDASAGNPDEVSEDHQEVLQAVTEDEEEEKFEDVLEIAEHALQLTISSCENPTTDDQCEDTWLNRKYYSLSSARRQTLTKEKLNSISATRILCLLLIIVLVCILLVIFIHPSTPPFSHFRTSDQCATSTVIIF